MPFLRVIEPFACTVRGVERVYRPGDLVDERDPIVTPQRRALFFEDPQAAVDRRATVEQATAAPGEKRSVTLPKRTRTAAPKS